jgi:hypothetical protein
VASRCDCVRSFSALILELPPWNPARKPAADFFYLWEVSMSDYTQIWSDLGLDLKADDALLFIPGTACHVIGYTLDELATEALYARSEDGRKRSRVVVGGITTQ